MRYSLTLNSQAYRTKASSILRSTIMYLCCHDDTGCTRIDGDITSHQPHILKLFLHLTVLLVTKSLLKIKIPIKGQ